jgi:hypothetical protein
MVASPVCAAAAAAAGAAMTRNTESKTWDTRFEIANMPASIVVLRVGPMVAAVLVG